MRTAREIISTIKTILFEEERDLQPVPLEDSRGMVSALQHLPYHIRIEVERDLKDDLLNLTIALSSEEVPEWVDKGGLSSGSFSYQHEKFTGPYRVYYEVNDETLEVALKFMVPERAETPPENSGEQEDSQDESKRNPRFPGVIILFYHDGGTPVLDSWYKKKHPDLQDEVQTDIAYLARMGHTLDRPHRGNLRDGLYELVISWNKNEYRIYYTLRMIQTTENGQSVNNHYAVLFQGSDKKSKAEQNTEIAEARKMLAKLERDFSGHVRTRFF
jgi:hypothetical protein